MKRSRFILATILAPAAALIGPAVLAFSAVYIEPALFPNGSYDNAPTRVAGIFLVVGLPVLYVLLATLYTSVGLVLMRMKRRSLPSLIWPSVVAPWPWVAFMAIKLLSNGPGTLADMKGLAVAGVAMSFFAAVGAVAWWFIALGQEPSGWPCAASPPIGDGRPTAGS